MERYWRLGFCYVWGVGGGYSRGIEVSLRDKRDNACIKNMAAPLTAAVSVNSVAFITFISFMAAPLTTAADSAFLLRQLWRQP